MAKKDEKDLTTEVFEGLQDMASKCGGKAALTLDRPDGWKWQLVVIPPGCQENEGEEDE